MQLLPRYWNLIVCLTVRSCINHHNISRSVDGGSPTVMAAKTRSPVTHPGDSSTLNGRKDPDCRSPPPALQELSPRTVSPSPRKTGRKARSQSAHSAVYCVNLSVPTPHLANTDLLSNRFGVCWNPGGSSLPNHPLGQSKVCRMAQDQVGFFVTESSARRLRAFVTNDLIQFLLRAGAGLVTTYPLC